jgi:hypothetical protein
MNVFVLGTGRCGATTFSKVCKLIQGFTSSHESLTSYNKKVFGSLDYPNNHIEIDPRLSYHIFSLKKMYPDALFFHLKRGRADCINSLKKRESLSNYSIFHYGWFKNSPENFEKAAELYYDNTTMMLDTFTPKNNILSLENIAYDFIKFCNILGVDLPSNVCAVLNKKHNSSKT